jgi:UDP-GlcNAc:undecaprenyl-phosphate/decaprenyl-phosphate GlcNAc-1-phosphate transferase
MLFYVAAFVVALISGHYWSPLMARAARQLGIVDKPDGHLKSQSETVPYLGGLAVFVAFLTGVGLFTQFEQETLGLLLSGTIILMVGLIDDFGAMTPKQKLLGQSLAGLVLIKSGIYIKLEFLPLWVALPLTLLWVLSVTNAFNIIDVMDGLAGGVGSLAALVIAVANFMVGRESIALLSIVLAGAVLGFLRWNFHPARIYLGDAGSLFIGFMLAALSMNAGYTRFNLVAAISPALILGVPLFDLAFVMYVRWRRGVPVMKGSPDHFALRLQRCRLSVPETAVVSYVITGLLGGTALLISQIPLQLATATIAGAVSVGLVTAFLLMKVDVSS